MASDARGARRGARPRIAAAALVAATALMGPPAASASSSGVAEVTTEGAPLAGTTQPDGEFTVAVAAPAGVTVKFKLDGTYLGQDSSPPYTWPIRTTAGIHTLNARWDDGSGRIETDAPFTVGTTPSPVPTSTPTAVPPPPTPASGTVYVSTSAQLTAALKAVKPGQTIALKDGTYVGRFVAATSGSESQRITLTGSRAAVLTTGSTASGYALHVTAPYWNITGFSVSTASKGVVLDGSHHTVIDGIDVGGTGAEAVHLRKNSASVTVRNSVIHDTGLEQPEYGEGIYVGSAKSNWSSVMGSSGTPDRSDSAQLLDNAITNTTAEGIDIKEGTTGGIVARNTFTNAGHSGENHADSWVDVKGNGYRITDNSGTTTRLDAFQVHVALDGWGRDNVFRGNTVRGGVPGFEVWVQKGAAGTVVGCDQTLATKGLSNVACAP